MKRIETSTSADLDFKNIEDYLLQKWSYDVLVDFYDKYDRALEILASDNVVFSRYEDTEFRKYLLTKHNTIIYKVENDIIYITRILQNFQDPDDNQKSIKS
ncbi:type II toxin-antitoxin system RelE/ParE family toxin [Epilithonimonas hominis]|uniref:type II toxin-antitoxin system RelE/ParE family toxin n=1 Tax=Epilithonimonas hominis TaxID=420404 RepID=UPI000EE4D19C|nr:hypothetical protein [Epilithonimonas hominis]HAP95691.1 hypothetical protein [Chryseobacterium sp.]